MTMAQDPLNKDSEHTIFDEGVRSSGRSPEQAGESENGPLPSSSEDSPLPLLPQAKSEPEGGERVSAGGQMANSPPAKVKTIYSILSSGIDTLYLAIYAVWYKTQIFEELEKLKEESKKINYEVQGTLKTKDNTQEFKFNIKPHGTKGYSWILLSNDYVLKIGKPSEIKARPSLMIEIRSEVLWRKGPKAAVDWIIRLLRDLGASIKFIKPSRVDFCIDILLPSEMWSEKLMDQSVTRATDVSFYKTNTTFTGVRIGKGDLSARIYDKGFEIITRSKKTWMFPIWDLDQVPSGQKVIRIEFQLRRPVLNSFLIDSPTDLFENEKNMWVYLTNWLKFQDRPGKHHTQRNTVEWWVQVQDGYHGAQGAKPAVRSYALKIQREQISNLMLGFATSLMAIKLEEENAVNNQRVTTEDLFHTLMLTFINMGKDISDLTEIINKKRVKYYRSGR